MKEKIKRWRYSDKNWKEINNDTLEFLLSQSESKLVRTIDISNQITSKGYQLISLSVALISIAIGYVIKTNPNWNNIDDQFLYFSIITILCLSISIIYLFKIIFPRKIILPGSEPKHLLLPKQISKYKSEKLQVKYFKLNELENNQFRIEYNRGINNKRIEYLKKVLISIIAAPTIALVIYLFSLCS